MTLGTDDTPARAIPDPRYNEILEVTPDAMVVVDGSGHIVAVNAQAERMFGYVRDELVGLGIEQLVPLAHREQHARHRARFMADPRTREMASGQGLHALRKDGSTFPVEISLGPLVTPERTLVASAIRDVTSRRETELALALANKELEAFSYSVAHDLRAPLRGMNGFAQILLADYADKLGPDGLDCLHEIRDNAERMGALIDALLSLSRVARSELRRERVDLSQIVARIATDHAARDAQRHVDVEVAPDLVAWVDPVLARVLLENLFDNAWKFTAATQNPRIEFGRAELVGGPAYYLRDNGAGFAMEYVKRLFSPFARLHSAVEFPGTGIGLATVQRIVRRHGGRVWAESRAGDGATFWFTLLDETGGEP